MKQTLLFFTFLLITLPFLSQISNGKTTTNTKFNEVFNYVNNLYVDNVNAEELTDAAIVAMLEKLDPHSTYITKEDVNDANSAINGSFVGIGIRFQIVKDTLVVVATIPGGPSEKLGVKPGDKIVKVDQENIAGIGIKNAQVREKLMGELGSKVKVEILRENVQKAIDFLIVRATIPIHSVDASYMITPEIGYIKLNSFSRSTQTEVQESLEKLKAQGMKHLIFDLQGNGGGLLDQAQKIADEFLSGNKLIVYSEGKSQPRRNLTASKKGLWEDGNLIVLTDEYSASASEIVSGAIQDWDRGLIVGRRSYGKGLVQRPIDLSDGSQIRLTIARYFTPSGRFIQKPYADPAAYKKDLTQRYLNGEFTNLDSIKLPDSLKYETLETKRTVYAGGGIMPDIFVPLDTTDLTDYYRSISRNGHINNFTFQFVNSNRERLMKEYPTFDSFKTNFTVTESFSQDFLAYIAQQDSALIFNQEEFNTSKKLIDLRIKAIIAQDLWGTAEFYELFNQSNEIVQRAVLALQNEETKVLKKTNKKRK